MTKIFRTAIRWLRSDNRKSKTCTELSRSIQNRKWARIVAIGVAVAMCGAVAEAHQSAKVPRIGYLTGATSARTEALRQRLRELGYVEGKNIVVEYRYENSIASPRSRLS
jgi:hypothetical protein